MDRTPLMITGTGGLGAGPASSAPLGAERLVGLGAAPASTAPIGSGRLVGRGAALASPAPLGAGRLVGRGAGAAPVSEPASPHMSESSPLGGAITSLVWGGSSAAICNASSRSITRARLHSLAVSSILVCPGDRRISVKNSPLLPDGNAKAPLFQSSSKQRTHCR